MLRITLRADDFGSSWPLEQPGEILTLLFAGPGEAIVLPEQGWRFPADAPAQEWRNYTVRAHRPDVAELDVDVLLHVPRGPACEGAEAAQVGSAVGYAGPRIDYAPVDGAGWTVLVGDETALPAIAAILETLPDGHPATAIVEVQDAADEIDLDLVGGQAVRWVHRGALRPGDSEPLARALRELPEREGVGQAWGAAESRVARDLRSVLRDERGMPKTHARARGYWLRSGDWLLDED
ncbi:MAG: siderophore-interacting protein [Patulibacter minatonensis]